MEKKYPWYDVLENNDNLQQGDFIKECPVIIPPLEIIDKVEVAVIKYNVIVMSQSCDLIQEKVDLVLVCPFWSLTDFGEKNSYYKGNGGKEALRRGYLPGYHLLNKCEIVGFESDYLVVDFRSVYSVSLNFILQLVGKSEKRLRLLPPYREQISQAFARFFMRVGLPVDIPPFK